MMLCYRGVRYTPSNPAYRTQPGNVIGKYRGVEVRSRHLLTPIPQPHYAMTYRGVTYLAHETDAFWFSEGDIVIA
jgi:hypothetical protein